ncbi:MAG: C40 family peptidase [Rhizobiaceae bacterium]|nr:C40 family peptidase [Rhizobiaceae bacterium]
MNLPVIDPLDKRLNAFNENIADSRLRKDVKSAKYVDGLPAQIVAPCVDMRRVPDLKTGIDTQLLLGQSVQVFERRDGFAWVQAKLDGYVGWVEEKCLSDDISIFTHRVLVGRSFVYPGPDLRFPRAKTLSMGSLVKVAGEAETRGTQYAVLASGEGMIASHLCPIDEYETDYVSVAERLIGTPYLWGGNSGFGIDCSGLIQIAMMMCEQKVLRDSDMQTATLGSPIEPGESFENLQRGDLIFWRGHAAIAQGDGLMVHASGHSMTVTSELLKEAIERIAYIYERPIAFKRLKSGP